MFSFLIFKFPVFIGVLLAVSAGPALSQSNTLNSQISSLLSDSQYLSAEDNFAINLREVSELRFKVGALPNSVSMTFADPANFIKTLESTWHFDQQMSKADEFEAITKFTHRYESEFLSAIDCKIPKLSLPTTLSEAASQIQRVAEQSRSVAQNELSSRQNNYLINRLEAFLGLIAAQPHGSDFSWLEKRLVKKYLGLLNRIDSDLKLCSANHWFSLVNESWLSHLNSLMEAHSRSKKDIIEMVESPLGVIVFSGSSDGMLLGRDVLFIADLAGNDFYGVEGREAFSGKPQLIVDFAGSDSYQATQIGSLGGAVGNVSVLVDFEGNDNYLGREFSLGSSLLGVAAVLDVSGDDRYSAPLFSQGLGLFGAGLLLDSDGNDEYLIEGLGQGLGLANGVGYLEDRAGSDHYSASGGIPTTYGTPGLFDAWAQGVGVGLRGIAPGGIGVLIDGNGEDTYDSGSFAQGGGYYLGLGVFHDGGESSDQYFGTRYNFSWGAHGGAGYFKEHGGDDVYRTRNIVSSGLAWDRSLAIFQDMAGNDNYDLGDFSLAAAGFGSVAVFIDYEGEDNYQNVIPADTFDSPPNLGLFIDAGKGGARFTNADYVGDCTLIGQQSFVFIVPKAIIDRKICD